MGGFLKIHIKKNHKTQEYLPLGKMNLNNYALRTYPALVYRSQYLQGNYFSLTFPLKQTNKKSAKWQSPSLSFYLVQILLLYALVLENKSLFETRGLQTPESCQWRIIQQLFLTLWLTVIKKLIWARNCSSALNLSNTTTFSG